MKTRFVHHIFLNCAVPKRVNCRYFSHNDLGACVLSQTGTLDCFLNVILYDFRYQTEPVAFGAPKNGGFTIKICRGDINTNI
jgi:hypothetical protein